MEKTKKANETKKAEKKNIIYTNRQKAIDDFMIDTGTFDTEEQAEAFIKSCITEKWLKSGVFSNRTLEILSYRYNDNLNYEEIGNKYGLTRERIRQIIKKSERIIKRRCLAILQRDSYILQNSQIY